MSCSVWRWLRRSLWSVPALFVLSNPALADDTAEIQELRQRLEQLEQRNAQLESAVLKRLPPVDTAISYPNADAPKSPDAKPAGGVATSAPHDVGSDLVLKPSWKNGLYFETAKKDFKVHVGGRVHQDWVAFDQSAALAADPAFGDLEDGVFFRRARVQVDGTCYEVIDWNAEYEFANTTATEVKWQDVWFQITQLPAVGNVRIGHVKQTFGLESYNSSRFLTFLERGAIEDAFMHEYDPGMVIWNTAFEERMTWATGVYRVDPEDDGIDFGDGELAFTGRVTGLVKDDPEGRYILHLGAAFSHRDSESTDVDSGAGVTNRDVLRFRARPEFRQAGQLPRFIDTGNIVCDSADLIGAEVAWVHGPLSVQGEYVVANVNSAGTPAFPVASTVDRGDALFQGYYVFASYFLTGEHRPYNRKQGTFDRVKPFENFWFVRTPTKSDPCQTCFGRGAWEVAARYSWVDLNDSGISGGTLEDYTLGCNWYLNPNFRVQWNYTQALRDVDPNNGMASCFAMRFAFDY